VIKHVVNDNGGAATAANFTLDSGGTNDTPDNFAGAESPGTEVTLDAGAYNVTESGPSGYTASFSADCSGSIGVGVTKTCTVTNNDQAAKLIVIKHVVNDNGGTATAANFTLDSGGTNDTPDNFAGAESPGTEVTLDAGAYNVTESGPSGYTASFSADCSGSLASGQTKTCTVTNDDSPAGTTSTTTMSWTLKDTMNLGALRRGTCGPAGTVVFKLYRYDFGTPNESLSCGGENLVWTSTDPATPGGPPTPPIAEVNGLASVSHDITQEGIYLWVVDYSGDNCNTPATNDCGREVTRISSEDLTAVPQP
jgi:hypothetical protein